MAKPKVFTLKYTTYDSVKVRLANKVQFQTDEDLLNGELPDLLLGQLIRDAETSVELELRSRYAVPFRSISKGNFDALPDHTKSAIRVLVDIKAVMNVLKTDFGRGTHVSGDSYLKDLKEDFKEQKLLVLGRDEEGKNDKIDRFRRNPPLEDLLLAASNREADDGFHGRVINTDPRPNSATYAENQINDPSRSYWGALGVRTRGRR